MDKAAVLFSARWNAGSRFFSGFVIFLVICGLVVQGYRLKEMFDYGTASSDWSLPVFALISVMSAAAGVILFG